MQTCIHCKDNSPKPANNRLTLKEVPNIPTWQTSRINNKRVISTLMFGTSEDSQPMISLSWCHIANL